MKYKVCSVVLIMVMNVQAGWTQSGRISASTSQLDTQWRNVEGLGAGEVIKVRRLSGKTVKGEVAAITSDALTAATKGGMVTIPRSEIREVKVRSYSKLQHNALLGGAIGAVSGVVTVVILDGALTDGNGVSGGAAVFLGAVGGAAGLMIGVFRPAYRTVYKTR